MSRMRTTPTGSLCPFRVHFVRTAGGWRFGLWPRRTAEGPWALFALDIGRFRIYATTPTNRAVSEKYRQAYLKARKRKGRS